MHDKHPRASRTWLNMILTILGGIGLATVFIGYLLDEKIRADHVVIPVFIAFSVIYLTERIGSIYSDMISDKEQRVLINQTNEIPSLLSGNRDLVSFPNSLDALKYMMNAVDSAARVKNTVLRYGRNASQGNYGKIYKAFVEQKRKTVSKERACGWMELVSTHFSDDDVQMQFIQEMNRSNFKYEHKLVDDLIHPIIQMTIIIYNDRPRELIFGYQFPHIPNGPVFMSSNANLVSFFDNYFMYFFYDGQKTNKSAKVTAENQPTNATGAEKAMEPMVGNRQRPDGPVLPIDA